MNLSVKSLPNPIPLLFRMLKGITALLGWTRSSYHMMGAFLMIVFMIGYLWWPLLEEYRAQFNPNYPLWRQIDWLLIGIFATMSLLMMARADVKADSPMIAVGFVGGLLIESWGTQTDLWFYYTAERPPLWIIPAWPITGLCIDRIYSYLDKCLNTILPKLEEAVFESLYWIILPAFYVLMLFFVWPSMDKSLTIMALLFSAYLILTPTDYRVALLVFTAGTGFGYFIEYWGTTRVCWTYYTLETPPLFSVPAHGMAAIVFWRMARFVKKHANRSEKGLPSGTKMTLDD